MIVSRKWLSEYLKPPVKTAELEERLMMAGLNHEGTHAVGDDEAINFEVTSNRPDCLGHLGIAREAAVLLERKLTLPPAEPAETGPPVRELTQVELQCPSLCTRYTARVIQGVKVGKSPPWLVERLATLGLPSINNVVDITNYVLLECGQPLHAFDLARLGGRRIIVREAQPGEPFVAINHKTYKLEAGMCVIADAQRPVALGGVMGGAESEVDTATTDVLLESALFDPLSIRNTARRLGLHSDSSYRFERGVDPEGVDWASRRACQLILELAGGKLAGGLIDVGRQPSARPPIRLRFSQLPRILGIDVPADRVRQILSALGTREVSVDNEALVVTAPSWRRDLEREIDLVEEVARIYGYDKIPEDVRVPMATSHRTRQDRVLERVRNVMTAAGFDEAMTLSTVETAWSEAFSPWTNQPPLTCSTPVLRRADTLRRSLVPSLLGAKHTNESLSNPRAELFEIARVYLARGAGELPLEDLMLGIVSGQDFLAVKGVAETLVASLCPKGVLEIRPTNRKLFETGHAAELFIRCHDRPAQLLGYLGEVSSAGREEFQLRSPATVAELRLAVLEELAELTPQYVRPPIYPGVSRDLNLVLGEQVAWAELERAVLAVAGPQLEQIELVDVFRDPKKLPEGKKSMHLALLLRSAEGTLTGEEADATCQRIVAACRERFGAELRG